MIGELSIILIKHLKSTENEMQAYLKNMMDTTISLKVAPATQPAPTTHAAAPSAILPKERSPSLNPTKQRDSSAPPKPERASTTLPPIVKERPKSAEKKVYVPSALLSGRSKEIFDLLKKLKKSHKDRYDEIVDMYNTLIGKITENKEKEQYRHIKNTNARLKETVFLNTETKKILELVGFIQADGNNASDPDIVYTNKLEPASLKLALGDFNFANSELQKLLST